MNSAVVEICAQCGGELGTTRVEIGGQLFHVRCSHDARDDRIIALEIAIRAALSFVQGRHADSNDGHAQMVIAALRGALEKR